MVQLKQKKINFQFDDKVTLVHHITQENSLLEYIESTVLDFQPGGSYSMATNTHELCLVALTGKYRVTVGDKLFESIGTRASVFEKIPTDSIYVPIGEKVLVENLEKGRLVLCFAPTQETNRETTLIKATDNSKEQRGKYNNQRLVHNILDDQSKVAEKLLVVEVFTRTANWSSYPPHKHDMDNLPNESFLEETYYHETNPKQGFVFQRVNTDNGILDETMTVNDGEMVLVPRGYHPVGVPDGYESYYLNIMAGPMKVWKFNNDKDHEWIIERS